MAAEKLFVVCYDVSRDRVRAALAHRLEGLGTRVQGSVFEVWMTRARAERLMRDLGCTLDAGDSLQFYPLTTLGVQGSLHAGRGSAPQDKDYYLL